MTEIKAMFEGPFGNGGWGKVKVKAWEGFAQLCELVYKKGQLVISPTCVLVWILCYWLNSDFLFSEFMDLQKTTDRMIKEKVVFL